MTRTLSFFLFIVLLGGLLFPSLLWAQTETKSKSRILVQRSTPKANLPILVSKRFFRIDPVLRSNLDVKQNSYVSQWMKSTYAKPSTTNMVAPIAERRLTEESTNNDKYLFYNDRIQVSHVYPNPASEFVDIDYQVSGNLDLHVAFFNILGEQVKEIPLDRDQRTVRISLRDFANGMYMYQLVIDGRSVATKKLIVRKGV